MHFWRKILTLLLMLWLPAQGFSAAFIPLSCHKHATAETVNMPSSAHHHARDRHHASAQDTQEQNHYQPCQNCNDCSLCHMGTAPGLPVKESKHTLPMSHHPELHSQEKPYSFIPGQPDRPPRTSLVC